MSFDKTATPKKRSSSQFTIFKPKTPTSSTTLRSSEEIYQQDNAIEELRRLRINSKNGHSLEENIYKNGFKCSSSSLYLPGISSDNPGQVGLSNLGNTCFMNCILQCLSHTTCFLSYCLQDKFLTELNKSGKMNGCLFISFADLMKKIWCTSSISVSPSEFKQQIQKYSPRFSGYLQQDAQEFLRYILEGLHEDVNRVRTKIAPEIPDYDREDKLDDCVKSKLYIDRYLRRDNSIIVDIFMGQLMSTLECLQCGYKSTTFDPFYDISLPIHKKSRNFYRDSVTIMDCISLFTSKESLKNDEQPICSQCKVRRPCQKSFTIQRFPKILVLHLKRFSGERLRSKLNTLIDFPRTELDLTQFASNSCTNLETGVYNLYGVANHSGCVYGGHYTAYCLNPISKRWYQFNDSKVISINESSIVSSEAYVLFYQTREA